MIRRDILSLFSPAAAVPGDETLPLDRGPLTALTARALPVRNIDATRERDCCVAPLQLPPTASAAVSAEAETRHDSHVEPDVTTCETEEPALKPLDDFRGLH